MWISRPMTSDCMAFYTRENITLVKETPKAIKVRLENSKDKLSVWMPKKCVRGFKTTQAWFWKPMFVKNIQSVMESNRKKQEKLKFNGAIAKEFSPNDLKILTQELDDSMEK